MERLRVIDSHTGGEPTRVVIQGLPDLGAATIAEAVSVLDRLYDRYRTAVIIEPRSSPVAVGAYLLPTSVADFGVVFFNNARYLGMCGHGTIGLVTTLAYLGLIKPGAVRFETPVGIVKATLHEDGAVSFDNVAAYRSASKVRVEVPGHGHVTGDVSYGGNWFFISGDHGQDLALANVACLTEFTLAIKKSLREAGITGEGGAEVDHIELVGQSLVAEAKNFVLCPGGEYDRSPCGTGTSAKLACLFEDGKLAEGQTYRVESIIGSIFEGSARIVEGNIVPTIKGRAYVNGETTVLIDPADPFAWGIG